MTDVAVVGGGVVGLAIAWRCAQRGMSVTVHDDQRPGAFTVAAGMLAPVSEAYFGEGDLVGLLVASAQQWPGFAAELAAYGDVGYRTEGTLVVALTNDDLAEADRLWSYQEALGQEVTRLRAAQLREREPGLHPRVRGGALTSDQQADPRRLLAVLRTAARAAGAQIVPGPVRSLSDVDAETVVVAAGCGSAELAGLPVRPVKVVPRADGEVVVGATAEERTDATPTAGAVLELLRAATDLLPELTEYELAEVGVGHRPGPPDNAPILGPLPHQADRPGRLVVATGHYRHGILLTPVTADAITELIVSGEPPELIAPFSPARFLAHEQVRS